MVKKLRQIAEYLWLAAIFVGVIYYLSKNWNDIDELVNSIPISNFISSFVLMILARLLLVEISRHATRAVGWVTSYDHMFYITSMSQLAKYLPGSIWQFVGRAAFYRSSGLDLSQITKSIIAENIWVVSGACITGLIGIILYGSGFIGIGASLLLIVTWFLTLRLFSKVFLKFEYSVTELAILILQLTIMWLLFGASFYVLINDSNLLLIIIGAFCISWVVGFVVIIAPGGIGIREAVLVTLLTSVIPPEKIIVFVGVHRMIWTLVELLMGIIAKLFIKNVDLFVKPVGSDSA